MKTKISFVIPAKNEQGNVTLLTKEITRVINKITTKWEIVFVDDGSSDNTLEELKTLHKKDDKIKIIRLRGNWGKSKALMSGFEEASGQIIITLDADLQDNPAEIPHFIRKIEEGYDLVSGWKKVRHDPPEKVIPSRIFNKLASVLSGVEVHDINCGFKAYKRDVVKSLNLYGEQYRFIPILAVKSNYKFTEIPVEHRARVKGKSKFGLERHLKGFIDLITVVFLTGYGTRPAHFFGAFGILSLTAGTLIGCYITYLRITTGSIQYRHPLLFLGILLIIIGIQLLTTGLLAEMILSLSHKSKSSKRYVSEKIV